MSGQLIRQPRERGSQLTRGKAKRGHRGRKGRKGNPKGGLRRRDVGRVEVGPPVTAAKKKADRM